MRHKVYFLQQELDQTGMFDKITKFQGHVTHQDLMAPIAAACLKRAQLLRGPVQLSIPRDLFLEKTEAKTPLPTALKRTVGNEDCIGDAIEIIRASEYPVIIAGEDTKFISFLVIELLFSFSPYRWRREHE